MLPVEKSRCICAQLMLSLTKNDHICPLIHFFFCLDVVADIHVFVFLLDHSVLLANMVM